MEENNDFGELNLNASQSGGINEINIEENPLNLNKDNDLFGNNGNEPPKIERGSCTS